MSDKKGKGDRPREWLVDPETGTARPMYRRRWFTWNRNGSIPNSYVAVAGKVRTLLLCVGTFLGLIWGGVAKVNQWVIVPQVRREASAIVEPVRQALEAQEARFVSREELERELAVADKLNRAEYRRLEALLEQVNRRLVEIHEEQVAGGRRRRDG